MAILRSGRQRAKERHQPIVVGHGRQRHGRCAQPFGERHELRRHVGTCARLVDEQPRSAREEIRPGGVDAATRVVRQRMPADEREPRRKRARRTRRSSPFVPATSVTTASDASDAIAGPE